MPDTTSIDQGFGELYDPLFDVVRPDLYLALFDVADLSPDTGEGGRWHLRNDYAWALRDDHATCVEDGDVQGAHDCNADALAALRQWTAA